MLRIKFGPYAEKVPLAWMVGRLRQRMGSRKGGDERLGYLHGSLKVLLNALIQRLEEMGVELHSSSAVNKLGIEDDRLLSVEFNGAHLIADKYLITIPSNRLADLLKQQMPDYSAQLNEVKYFGAMCIIMEMKKSLSDIYWLNVAESGFPFGGVIEHTNFIEPGEYNGSHIAYLSRYFAHEEDIANMDQDSIKKLMLEKLPLIYPDFKESDLKEVYLFKTMTAATVCDMNFSDRIPNFQTPIENMYIANMSHVYPDERSTNNSIRVAASVCKVMGMDTSYVPENTSLSGKIGF
jgi:protoporphyrinogen oxidase